MVQGFQALGATADQLAFPALYGALESGKFDGQENPIATIVSAKFDKVQKYPTMSGHVYSWAVFSCRRTPMRI
jgi:TRAP-type transport system periplasmic protein